MELAEYRSRPAETQAVTMQEAAGRLRVSTSSIKRLIEDKLLPATQVVPCAPWQIPVEGLN
jgi:hypothetical protein